MPIGEPWRLWSLAGSPGCVPGGPDSASRAGATIRLYIDGVLQNSVASALSLPNTATTLRISDGSYGGTVDEVAITTSVLSLKQVQDHYQAGKR